MDLATLLGLFGAFAVVVAAIFLGGSAGMFFNIPSIFIVIGGTAMVVLVKFTLAQYFGAFKAALNAFKAKLEKPEDLIPQIVEMSSLARKEGLLALENVEISNSFLKSGINMLIDGASHEDTKKLLTRDKNEIATRHKLGAQVFEASGDVAPAMGMIGTLIGLVQMLSNMDDPKAIGPAMAVALLTTLYGAILANMVFLPVADKLKLTSIEAEKLNAICMDGILALQEGQNPRVIESMLKLYVNPKLRNVEKEPPKEEAA